MWFGFNNRFQINSRFQTTLGHKGPSIQIVFVYPDCTMNMLHLPICAVCERKLNGFISSVPTIKTRGQLDGVSNFIEGFEIQVSLSCVIHIFMFTVERVI